MSACAKDVERSTLTPKAMTPDSISELLQLYINVSVGSSAETVDWPRIYSQLAIYLELILKWNERINLTAIRKPEEIVRRHFAESLFLGWHIGACHSLLDLGSGAGFPGIPVQLMRPDVHVTLAESQGKKAAFLREVVRELRLQTEVWAGRVESMPEERRFDVVALRAVDDMEAAVREAGVRASQRVLILASARQSLHEILAKDFCFDDPLLLPESSAGVLLAARRR
jgi:16S rRNA (guanine527-N7)-methyltransferase